MIREEKPSMVRMRIIDRALDQIRKRGISTEEVLREAGKASEGIYDRWKYEEAKELCGVVRSKRLNLGLVYVMRRKVGDEVELAVIAIIRREPARLQEKDRWVMVAGKRRRLIFLFDMPDCLKLLVREDVLGRADWQEGGGGFCGSGEFRFVILNIGPKEIEVDFADLQPLGKPKDFLDVEV